MRVYAPVIAIFNFARLLTRQVKIVPGLWRKWPAVYRPNHYRRKKFKKNLVLKKFNTFAHPEVATKWQQALSTVPTQRAL